MTQSIYSSTADKYDNQTSAEALFFHSSLRAYVKGLRVLLPDKGLEFSDNSYVGTDPSGFFYYDDIEDAKKTNKYVSDTTINPKNNQLCAWVKFYNTNASDPNKIICEFLGDDYFNTVSLAGMIGYTHAGQWGVSSANSYVEAHLKKDANSSTITLDITKALSKTATMTTSDSTLTASSFSDISGHFHYDSLNTISSGTYVSYSNDRLVFYQNDNTGTTFTGYYIPNGRSDSATLLGIQGSTELTLSGTVWS